MTMKWIIVLDQNDLYLKGDYTKVTPYFVWVRRAKMGTNPETHKSVFEG